MCERALALALLTLLVLVVLDQANPLTTPMGRDSGVFAHIASHLLKGQTPYVFAWDHKPPLIYFINALALLLGRGTRWGIWGMEFLSLLAAMLVASATLRRRFGLLPALFACGTLLLCLDRLLFGGNFTEEYSLLFNFLSLWLFSRLLQRTDALWPHFGLGLTFAFNFLLRPNNRGVQLAIFITEAVLALPKMGWRGAVKSCLAIGVGIFLPLAAVSWYFAMRGAFSAFVEASFTYNLIYSAQPDVFSSLLSGTQLIGAPAWIAMAGVGVATWLLARDARSRPIQPFTLWLCLDLSIEVDFSGLSGRDIFHYFISWMPFIAVSGALLPRQLVPRLRGRGMPYVTPILAAILWAF
jgi:dolichyl-phosphate-mannose-protein mannosyltransferase